MISKTLSTSQRRAALHQAVPALAEFCQQLYPLLVSHADDFGRLQGDAFTVKHAIDPTSPRPIEDFALALNALQDVGLIRWYAVEPRRFIQIENFDPHQVGLHKRTSSVFPPPPDPSGNVPEPAADFDLSGNVPSELKGTEPKGTKQNRTTASAEPKAGSTPTLIEFPTVGADGQCWPLSEAQRAEWAALFPGLDVLGECRAALAWLMANPGRRKTGRGMAKFLVGWLTRSNDRGGRNTGGSRHDAPISHAERTKSEQLRRSWGRCQHEPRCENYAACLAAIVQGWREQEAAAS
jgi:hypothetical protein